MALEAVLGRYILRQSLNCEVVTGESEVARVDASNTNNKNVPGHKLSVFNNASIRALLHTVPIAIFTAAWLCISL